MKREKKQERDTVNQEAVRNEERMRWVRIIKKWKQKLETKNEKQREKEML